MANLDPTSNAVPKGMDFHFLSKMDMDSATKNAASPWPQQARRRCRAAEVLEVEDPLTEVQELSAHLDRSRGVLLSSSYEYPGRRGKLRNGHAASVRGRPMARLPLFWGFGWPQPVAKFALPFFFGQGHPTYQPLKFPLFIPLHPSTKKNLPLAP